jgi:FLYWCH zinc finger domain
MAELVAVIVPGKKFTKTVLVYDGYVFHKNKTDRARDTIYYKCKVPDCTARGSQRGPSTSSFMLTRHHSNHEKSPMKIEQLQLLNNIKKRVVCESRTLKDIFVEEAENPE